MTDVQLLMTASEVWEFVRTRGGTNLTHYDQELENEIRKELNTPGDEPLADLLAGGTVSVEDFIFAFFRSAQPFVDMMSDLLVTFQRAGATQGDHNLEVEFDFSKERPALNFNLEHFRHWIERWREVTRLLQTELWGHDTLWALNGVLRADFNALSGYRDIVSDASVRDWMDTYMAGVWPPSLPAAPRTGFAELDPILARAWNVWTDVFTAIKALGQDHSIVMSRRFDQEALTGGRLASDLPRNTLWLLESDYWPGSFVIGGYAHAELMRTLPAGERASYAAELAGELASVFERVPKTTVAHQTLLRALEDFLSLPMWERRYELYSAWVSTLIVGALEDYGVRVHHDNGVLVYSFSGTHLATCDDLTPHLHVMAEVRSPLENPKGHGRTNAIQPDYTLLTDPVTAVRSAVLVVECKQYLRAAPKSFAAALDDYARGRPGAQVVLVNYGPARAEIADRVVDPELRGRVHVLGGLRPGAPGLVDDFRKLVRETVERRYQLEGGRQSDSVIPVVAAPFAVTLSWRIEPQDLDLRLDVSGSSLDRGVTYCERGARDAFPWATYAEDIQTGFGPEQIVVHRLEQRLYRFSVHKFAPGSSMLAGCGAVVTVITDDGVIELQCPETGEGDWWVLFTVDGQTGTVTIPNELVTELAPI
ncbi:MAG TPA: hypothetical protein VF665_14440 [Longimicrobium sp.]|uniref:hypothetical protein n=1 Tax=Longimicrobium sp. TaxID=2029185 RepID=UPI002EDB7FFE